MRGRNVSKRGVGAHADLMGVKFDAMTLDQTILAVEQLMASTGLGHVVTANLDYMAQVGRDPALARVVDRADLVVADGVPLLWMARWSRQRLPERVNGTDLVLRLLQRASNHDWPVAFLGGEPGVAEQAGAQAATLWSTPVGGVWPLTPAEVDDPASSRAVAQQVGALGRPLVLVGLGAGRQDRWIDANRDLLGEGVVIGVGSALDFIAGTRRRAPRVFQRAGLEWLWRLALEPGRLWHRYLVEDTAVLARFAVSTARTRLGRDRQ